MLSGMAKGIDGAAMKGALRAGGFTAAVLGGGVDVVYPAENRRIYEDVAATGVVLSEYPPGTEPMASHFPVRNRILSGLSLAAVVVEAPERSGALITASTALEQGREVFAVPGPINAPTAGAATPSSGTARALSPRRGTFSAFTRAAFPTSCAACGLRCRTCPRARTHRRRSLFPSRKNRKHRACRCWMCPAARTA